MKRATLAILAWILVFVLVVPTAAFAAKATPAPTTEETDAPPIWRKGENNGFKYVHLDWVIERFDELRPIGIRYEVNIKKGEITINNNGTKTLESLELQNIDGELYVMSRVFTVLFKELTW